MQEPENDCSYYQEDELSSALSRPGEFTLAEGIQILPHLPKYSICITKGPSEFLGSYYFFFQRMPKPFYYFETEKSQYGSPLATFENKNAFYLVTTFET